MAALLGQVPVPPLSAPFGERGTHVGVPLLSRVNLVMMPSTTGRELLRQ